MYYLLLHLDLYIYATLTLVLGLFLPFYFWYDSATSTDKLTIRWCRHRIPFAIEVMKAAITVIDMYPGTQYTAFLCLLLQLGWTALAGYILYKVVRNKMSKQRITTNPSKINVLESASLYIAVIYLVFSYYWVFEGVYCSFLI